MAKHPPPPPGAERRQHPRVDVFAQVEVLRGDVVMVLAVLNVSMGGAFLELPEHGMIAAGDEMVLHITVDDRETTQPARVVRVIEGGFAVTWVDRKPDTVALVSSLLRGVMTGPLPVIPPSPSKPPPSTPPKRSPPKRQAMARAPRSR